MFRWRKRRSEGRAVPSTLTPLLTLDAYDHRRQLDRLAAELTPSEFGVLAKRNGWQPLTIGLLLDPPVPTRAIQMGRLTLTLMRQAEG